MNQTNELGIRFVTQNIPRLIFLKLKTGLEINCTVLMAKFWIKQLIHCLGRYKVSFTVLIIRLALLSTYFILDKNFQK